MKTADTGSHAKQVARLRTRLKDSQEDVERLRGLHQQYREQTTKQQTQTIQFEQRGREIADLWAEVEKLRTEIRRREAQQVALVATVEQKDRRVHLLARALADLLQLEYVKP